MGWLGMISAWIYCIDELIKETPHSPLKSSFRFLLSAGRDSPLGQFFLL
jgi:hypothetical protein